MKVKSPFISDDPAQDVTRRHLLEAAGEVFAEEGFRAATVREICQRAGANVRPSIIILGTRKPLMWRCFVMPMAVRWENTHFCWGCPKRLRPGKSSTRLCFRFCREFLRKARTHGTGG